jgi:hypothetical protein
MEAVSRSQFLYYADDKFDAVIDDLNRREHVTRIFEFNSDEVQSYSALDLIWTNLKSINFDHITNNQYVNHYKGSQHFSNKAFLAYHLHNFGGFEKLIPWTWAPSYQQVSQLIFALLLSSMEESWDLFSANILNLQSLSQLHLKIVNILEKSEPSFSSEVIELKEIILGRVQGRLDFNDLQKRLRKLFPSSSFHKSCDIWIIKPVGLSCGEKIVVTKGLLPTLYSIQSFGSKCIVQKYIERPLLVRRRRKFDVRQWVLVTSLTPLIVYGFSECYLRLSSKEFSLDEVNLQDPLIHLCNHAIQKLAVSDQFSNTQQYVCDTMMSLAEFEDDLRAVNCSSVQSLVESGVILAENEFTVYNNLILPQIRTISSNMLNSVVDRLGNFGRGFEWLGLDLMVTEDLEVQLIEVNTSPDISHSTPITSRLVDAAVQDLFNQIIPLEKTPGATIELESIPRYSIGGKEESRCTICCANQVGRNQLPHWCCWHVDESYYSSVQPTFASKKKSKLQANCIPSDAHLLSEVLRCFQSDMVHDEDEL